MIKKGLLTILCLGVFILICNPVTAQIKERFTVVIDAGHGGRDPGATRGKYKEKVINLKVALALGKLIENNYKDVKVVYTRKTDIFIDLVERANIANRNKANLFISIHTNATDAKNTSANGADTYILGLTKSAENLAVAKRENAVITFEKDYKSKYEGFDPNSPESYIIFEFMTNKYMEQSYKFASAIQNGFKTIAKRNDRGVRQAGFLVLWRSAMPSVLVELGFINNANEAKYLYSSAGQNAMARSIYSGFKKYKAEYDKMMGNTVTYAPSDEFDLTDEPDTESEVEITDIAENKSNSNASTKSDANNGKVEYKVQFLSSSKKLPANSSQFKGLKPVEFYKDGSTYRYTYGATTDKNEILKIQRQVRTKFKDAFVIEMKNGKRIK